MDGGRSAQRPPLCEDEDYFPIVHLHVWYGPQDVDGGLCYLKSRFRITRLRLETLRSCDRESSNHSSHRTLHPSARTCQIPTTTDKPHRTLGQVGRVAVTLEGSDFSPRNFPMYGVRLSRRAACVLLLGSYLVHGFEVIDGGRVWPCLLCRAVHVRVHVQ